MYLRNCPILIFFKITMKNQFLQFLVHFSPERLFPTSPIECCHYLAVPAKKWFLLHAVVIAMIQLFFSNISKPIHNGHHLRQRVCLCHLLAHITANKPIDWNYCWICWKITCTSHDNAATLCGWGGPIYVYGVSSSNLYQKLLKSVDLTQSNSKKGERFVDIVAVAAHTWYSSMSVYVYIIHARRCNSIRGVMYFPARGQIETILRVLVQYCCGQLPSLVCSVNWTRAAWWDQSQLFWLHWVTEAVTTY